MQVRMGMGMGCTRRPEETVGKRWKQGRMYIRVLDAVEIERGRQREERRGAEDMYYTRYNSRSRGMAGRDGSCGSSRGRKRACRVKESKEGG